MVDDSGKIVGSVRGKVENGSLYIGRLIVLPEFQHRGIGKQFLHEIQATLPHDRAWLNTCGDIERNVRFYEKEGFRVFNTQMVNHGKTSWLDMEKV